MPQQEFSQQYILPQYFQTPQQNSIYMQSSPIVNPDSHIRSPVNTNLIINPTLNIPMELNHINVPVSPNVPVQQHHQQISNPNYNLNQSQSPFIPPPNLYNQMLIQGNQPQMTQFRPSLNYQQNPIYLNQIQ